MKSNKTKQNGGNKPNNGAITDNRFKHAQNDPKFKMYRRKDKAVQLDNRFGDLMKSNSSFTSDAPIDEYGRKIVNKKIDKSIKKTYVLENEEKEEKEEKEKKPKSTTKKEIKKPVVESESESESEVEEEESINSDIESEKVIEYGGFEYNSDTESSDAEEFQGDDIEEEEEEEEEVPRGDATKRFAVLNCDWDNITSKQLFILLNSFVPSSGGGHIERITIYPSDFGLEQMAREKSLGPNKEIWDSSKAIINNSNNNGLKESSLSFDKLEDAESLDGKGFNLEKLRQYELSKLRYYYAVVECSSIQTANKIYEECEGMEIEDTANVLDLRFIPDDQKFTNTPRDTCTELPASTDENGGFGFQTSILKGTAVDFTWDIDKTRKKLLTKNFSKFDAREEDLRAYLADPTSSEESSEESSDDGDNNNNNNKNGKQTTKNSKRLALRNKYKSLLLDGIEDEEEKDDIQITFNSAFSDTLKQQKQQKSNESDDDDDDDDGLSIKFSDQEIGSSDEEDEESDKEGIINKENDDDESDSAADDESSENESGDDDDDDDDDDNLLNGSDSETPDWAKDLKSDSEDDTVQEMVINTNLNNVGKKLLKEKEKRENGNVFTDYLEKKKEKKSQKKRERRIEIEKLIKEKEEKEKQQKKNKSKGRVTEEEKKEKAELELLLMDDDLSKNKGYTKKQLEREAKMNTIDPIERKKLEKKLKKKNQKMDVQDDKHLIDLQGFKMNTTDNRFHSMFIDPAYAIDPTDPKFKRTTGMVEMLTEKKNRRKVEKEKEEKEILERRNKLKDQNLNSTTTNSTTTTTTSKSSLSEMAQNIKRKAEEQKNKENSKKFKK
ncbi:hypothetical protein DDB_G0269312 [Dictyostelium discoideum AX4]|uniref:Uncharacterized protein n=1 Tax=Dictyostelium discoideum TaxID=44689 RepID=Q55EB8_DICDI|nr:hypothetical protein DDB_G0269312 [Dictyostelium discoideum AX4]EAL72006.1 hypothetical protein DDB_G0269312 [Dictyostelium discoideum AX4]|eukprot:XP_645863.1 hypothetical protein DDB_G0269312 [Dictyostelium discoideum AX4]